MRWRLYEVRDRFPNVCESDISDYTDIKSDIMNIRRESGVKITFLEHSGYVIEERDKALIFDFYKGTLPAFSNRVKVYVFASHAHGDHFNKRIFEWEGQYPDIHYILSDNIKDRGPEGTCTYIGPRRLIQLDEMEIQTLRSTDEGVAYLVKLWDKKIYHGGDLNWWHWEEESKAYNEMMRRKYQHEIGKLEGEPIDAAFLPLDPRQEEQYAWGLDYFMRHTQTRHAFPMHMWGQYDICSKLLASPVSGPYRDRFMRVDAPGQVFLI